MMVVPLAWTEGASALMTATPPAVERLPDLFQGVSYSVLAFLRHLRFWSKAHGEVLRYSTLRQQLRHEDEPLVAGIVLIVLPAAGGKERVGTASISFPSLSKSCPQSSHFLYSSQPFTVQVESFADTVDLFVWVQGAFVTVTTQVADWLPACAVMVAVPVATAVTLPLVSTVATAVLLDVHVTVSVVSFGSTVAIRVSFAPV